jgi:Peptidase M15
MMHVFTVAYRNAALLISLFAAVLMFSSVEAGAAVKAGTSGASAARAAQGKPFAKSTGRTKKVAASTKRRSLGAKSATRRSGGIVWNAGGRCLPGSVKSALNAVASNYGTIIVNSTHRSRGHNRRVGGAGRSMHLQCRAADFRVVGGGGNVLGFLQKLPGLGGIKRYRSGFFHIDNGPRRTWKG